MTKAMKVRITGDESCFVFHRQRRSKAVDIIKFVPGFNLCRPKRSLRGDIQYSDGQGLYGTERGSRLVLPMFAKNTAINFAIVYG